MKTFNELRKNWMLNFKTYKEFLYNFNYTKVRKLLNNSNVWLLKMILNNNIVITNVQDFRFITGSSGGNDWVLYKLLLKINKKDIKELLVINNKIDSSKNINKTYKAPDLSNNSLESTSLKAYNYIIEFSTIDEKNILCIDCIEFSTIDEKKISKCDYLLLFNNKALVILVDST